MGCGVTLVDKNRLLRHLPEQKISTMSTLLKVRGIRASKHKSEKFAALFLYFPGTDSIRKLVYALLRSEIHLVKGLKANLLIGNDIMLPKNFVIDIKKKTTLIKSYTVTVSINAKQKGQFFTRKLPTSKLTVVPPQSEALILLVPVSVLDNYDFFFQPASQSNLTLFIHIIDY